MDPYENLACFLASVKDALVSIEIVPTEPELEVQLPESKSHSPFLFADGNIGIPQPILYKAYLSASKQLPHLTLDHARSTSSMADVLVSATAILLIANPAHNTALNRRKQLIQMYPLKLTLDEEINFIAALFGIKHASKSSLLWHHRRWLFRLKYKMSPMRFDTTECDPDSLGNTSIPVEVLRSEFRLVARASELYPRNYHAWLHRYLCAQCLISQVQESVPGALEVLSQEVEASQRWLELHVSDYTAAQYLFRLVNMLQSLCMLVPFPSPPYPDEFRSLTASIPTSYKYPIISNALSLVGLYPTHESLWLYLRLSWNALDYQHHVANRWMIDVVLTLNKDNLNEGDQPNALVQQIHSSCRTEDLPIIRKYALHFLTWTMLLKRDGITNDAIPRILTDPELPEKYVIGLCS